jgi:hypothetical protein
MTYPANVEKPQSVLAISNHIDEFKDAFGHEFGMFEVVVCNVNTTGIKHQVRWWFEFAKQRYLMLMTRIRAGQRQAAEPFHCLNVHQ